MRLKDSGLTAKQVEEITKKYMIEFGERLDFVCDHAEGMYMYDGDGNAYLDFFAGIAVNGAGSCSPRVVEAIREQAGDLIHASNYIFTLPQALLAEKVCTTIGMDKIFFQNSGTEANEAMIKLARKYGIDHYGPHKYGIVTAYRSFHGRTFAAMTATGQPGTACQDGFGDLAPGFKYARFNDLEDFRAAVDENTIAIMVEPVQGEGGVYPATKEFLQGLRDLCDEKGLLLLFDEVQTGWGRTGDVMAYMRYGVKPDIVTMAKALGGGFPIGAICANAKTAASFTPGSHGSTFAGNALGCATALAEISTILDDHLPENAKTVGPYLMKKLETLPHIKEVRGLGLLVGVEFDGTVNAPQLKKDSFRNGLLTTAVSADTLRLLPPLIVTEADCDQAVAILEKSVEEQLA